MGGGCEALGGHHRVDVRLLQVLEELRLARAQEDLVQAELVVLARDAEGERDRLDEVGRLELLHELGHVLLVPVNTRV